MKRIIAICGLDKKIRTAPLECQHEHTTTDFTQAAAGGHFVIVGIDRCLDCGKILQDLPETPPESLQDAVGAISSALFSEKVK